MSKFLRKNWIAPVSDPSQIKLAKEIIKFISEQEQKLNGADLMYGSSGIAIFHYYNYVLQPDQSSLEKCFNHSQHSIDLIINKETNNLYFGKGIAGSLWGLIHLRNHKVLDFEIDEILASDFLIAFEKKVILDLDNGDYDFLLGALGAFLFFLEIGRREICRKIISKLISISTYSPNGIYWNESPCVNKQKGKVINLGLAHGIPSILVSLAYAYEANVLRKKTNRAILDGLKWLNYIQEDPKVFGVFFPYTISENEQSYKGSIRWCYGDLGISIGLINIGQLLDSIEITNVGISIALDCLKRDITPESIIDSHLCHGTAGIAHIYNRIYNYTGIEKFRTASEFWFNQTIIRFDQNLISGFRAWKGNFGWIEYDGLLEGSAGIGLSLISAISDVEPKWDRSLLLS
jgi:lantibiotic biosynthesis protein